MKIGLNLLYLIPGEVGGTETYALSLIQSLGKLDLDNTYYIYLNNESQNINLPKTNNFIPVHCRVKATNRLFRFLWEQLILPFQVIFHRLDILHSLGYISPLLLSCASVVTIHDLNYIAIPEAFSTFTRMIQQVFVTLSAKRANHIIAVSEFTKGEIIRYLSIPANKISVTLEAPKARNGTRFNENDDENFLSQSGIHKPYLLALSSLAPHKNIERLIEAFQSADTIQDDCWMLVIAGHLPAQESEQGTLSTLVRNNPKIITTGYVSDLNICRLFRSADLFVFPSLYEGFGLPVLEAMAYGTPVACSNHGSLPEIANGAAEYFDPIDIKDISLCIGSLMQNPARRDDLRSIGHKWVNQFSWDKTAAKTLEIYQSMFASE